MSGWIDESLRIGPSGLYVVAVVVVPEDLDAARDAARSVLLRRQRRFHWRDESETQRHRMIEQIRALDVTSRAYVAQPIPSVRGGQARARALCINSLLWDVWQGGVDEITFETRQDHNDRRDRSTIIQAQQAQRASPTLTYSFEQPGAEPLLWLADAVAGAVSGAVGPHPQKGAEGHLAALGKAVIRTTIRP